ncbi:glycosyltransferase family 25 protein [Hoeflea prorocentri]|uniref:Glycosyltransferase family 25 protein n=1 Tax=Hoeflea prorocentri TaxID=1922333 RepID=A0A9X3ZK36_9HYPH|nr:glycosyltransferase family 25 protein [Hoeflea prorocentri]MCY6383475.1 glycosyltransferase family 25 protein [Hoeflea prorocentri]MDA5401275.1 glycosyltransferase family 25 protein [Hoeflea prorocentri]
MDRHPERLRISGAALDSLGLNFQRLAGVDYRELDPQTIGAAVDKTPAAMVKRQLSPGEIACFLSHIKVWRAIAESSEDMAWVFEDDVSFCANARTAMLEIESGKRDWDLVRLYSHKALSLERIEPMECGYSIGLSRKIPMSTIGYAISRPAADFLSRAMVPFSLPVDSALKQWWDHGLCTKVVAPSLCEPRKDTATASTLDASRANNKPKSLVDRFVLNLRYQFEQRRMRHGHAARFPDRNRFDW